MPAPTPTPATPARSAALFAREAPLRAGLHQRALRVRAAHAVDIGPLERFYASLSMRTRAQRFFSPLRQLPSGLLKALESADPRHRFLVIEITGDDDTDVLLGLGQYAIDASGACADLAIVVADDWQGRGLGTWLASQLIEDAAAACLQAIELETERSNRGMQALARRAGFRLRTHPEDSLLLLGQLSLRDRTTGPHRRACPAPRAS